jgi:exopolysaccharide biosynthesis protein
MNLFFQGALMKKSYKAAMKKGMSGLVYFLFLCSSFFLCSPADATSEPAFAKVDKGLEYIHRRLGDEPWSIHILKIKQSESEFQFVSTLARDKIFGLASLREQISRIDSQLGVPLAAVNGDFFRIRTGPYQGDPLGLQIVNGLLVSSPTGASFWINANGRPKMGHVKSKFKANLPNGQTLRFEINEECLDDEAILYTDTLGPSTRTEGALEIILDDIKGLSKPGLAIGDTFTAKVHKISSTGDSTLQKDTMILAVSPKQKAKADGLKQDDVISFSLQTTPDLTSVKTAIAGGPILIKDGKKIDLKRKPVRHPRTAIGFNDEHFFLVVVDGRQEGLSVGMTLKELASLMLSLGCKEAMNLDGGGSSTFYLGGKVLNSPSDGRQRSIANGLVLLRREKKKIP